MALPIIQPQTINYAQWDWNPGTTFLAAARTTASMLDNIKQAEQMDRKIALEEQIKTTLLPYEVADAQAKIDYTKAQTALAASRSRALADGAQTLSMLDSMDGMATEQLYDIAGLPVESSSAPSSPAAPAAKKQFNLNPGSTPSPIGGSFDSINAPADNPLQSFNSQDDGALYSIAARLPDGSSMSQLTDPKFALASAKDGMSTDAPAKAEEMGVLQARANAPKVTNPLDWDETPAVTETPAPAKAKPAWDSGVESELQGIRSQLGTNPLESLEVQRPEGPLIEAYASEADRPEGPSIGAYISKRYSDLQTAAQNAKNAKGNDRKVINAAAGALERRLYEDVASKYDIDDPVVVQNLVKGPGGLRRTADEIESIYGIMRDRSVELPDKTGTPRQVAVTNWSEAFQAAELKRGSIKSSLEATATSDPLKQLQDRQVAMKNFLELKTAASENQEDKTLQAAYRLSLSDMKSVYGDEWDRVEFGLNQQDFGNALKFQGQSVDIKGLPADGLKSKTADQVRMEMIQRGEVPIVSTIDGAFKEEDLKKLPEGYFVTPTQTGFSTYQKLGGKIERVGAAPIEDKDETEVPSSKGFSGKNPFAKQAEQEIRAKEIGSRKTDLDSAKTQLKAVEREIEILSNPPQESAASQRLGLPNYPASNISKAKKFEELSSKKKQLEQIIQTKRGFRRG